VKKKESECVLSSSSLPPVGGEEETGKAFSFSEGGGRVREKKGFK